MHPGHINTDYKPKSPGAGCNYRYMHPPAPLAPADSIYRYSKNGLVAGVRPFLSAIARDKMSKYSVYEALSLVFLSQAVRGNLFVRESVYGLCMGSVHTMPSMQPLFALRCTC